MGLTAMLNFAINNEAIQGSAPVPLLTNNPSIEEMSVMAKSKHSRKGLIYQGARSQVNPGDKFTRWTVLKEVKRHEYPSGDLRRQFLCRCDCGVEKVVKINQLMGGQSKSCGCYNRDQIIKRSTKHGHSGHPLQDVYGRMVQCCTNPKNENYKNYGGRGITLCDEWKDNFKAFYDWAIRNGWEKGLIIDRINNDDGYHPLNCRFVDYGLSARNRRLLPSNNKSGYRGVHHCYKKWRAAITLNNKKRNLGMFNTPEEAAHAYDAKAKELNAGHPLNFPDEV